MIWDKFRLMKSRPKNRANLSGWRLQTIAVKSRLWLGCVINEHRDSDLIVALFTITEAFASALGSPLCIISDGLAVYIKVLMSTINNGAIQKGYEGLLSIFKHPDIKIFKHRGYIRFSELLSTPV